MPQVILAKETVVQASPERVWEIVVDPARMPALDPRLALVSASGPAGTAASGYVLDVRTGPRTQRLEYVVTEAESGVRIVTEARRRGRARSVQEGRLDAIADGGTRLVWLIRAAAPAGLGWLVSYRARQELARWMAGVVRAAEGTD